MNLLLGIALAIGPPEPILTIDHQATQISQENGSWFIQWTIINHGTPWHIPI